MTIFKAFIKNIVISNLWSVLLGIICVSICTDLVDNDATFIIFICWFINAIISFFIHLFLFTPGILIYRKNYQKHNILEAYKTLYPLLLIPLALYVLIIVTIISDSAPKPNIFGLIAFAGMSLMLMHSISLYTFIYQNLKNDNHEEIIE